MKNRTLLVDASYLLKRSFHGAKDTYTSSFGHIGGLYQFMTTLRKLIKQHMSNKVVLAWDGENGGIYRYQLDTAYKANHPNKSWHEKIVLSEAEVKRENDKEQSILKQRKRVQAYAEELYLRQIEVNEIEGDDLIAAYCEKYHEKEEIILFTNDRDFVQLLSLNITIHFGNIETPITKRNFFHYFPYNYRNGLIMKIICGDVSDNIKGIVGLKEKTLLNHFPDLKTRKLTVREICIRADEINKKRVEEKKKPLLALKRLLESVDRLKLNYRLVNLQPPILNKAAVEELEQLDMPLSSKGRNSRNLTKMMAEDEFLSVYNSNFVSYVEPFYSVIMNEKQMEESWDKKNRNSL